MNCKRNRHHRLPKSRGGSKTYINGYKNVILVDAQQHIAWHQLFQNFSAEHICSIVNEWIDPNKKMICVRREKGKRTKRRRR
jgi:hypothetical protein